MINSRKVTPLLFSQKFQKTSFIDIKNIVNSNLIITTLHTIQLKSENSIVILF